MSQRPAARRSCLFLDRDGVLIEDTGYPHDPASIVLIPETLELVRLAKDRGFVVGLVTNQSGIGRGYFGWDAFAAVQGAIDAALAMRGATLDFTLACPHHANATLTRYRHDGHPWRKPAPGMLLDAINTLGIDPVTSAMLGDQISDMEAAQSADVRHRGLLVEQGHHAPNGDWAIVGRQRVSVWLRQIVEDP